MGEVYLKIAAGYEMIAAGYRELAENGQPLSKEVKEEIVPKKDDNSQKEEKVKESETLKVTIEDVRAVLAVKTRDGKTQKVKALLNEFGADKLSSVPEDKLADLKARAEVL